MVALSGCATLPGDPYFTRTKSKANIYVAPVSAGIKKVAIMPFKAPTELFGSSISELFVTEMLRSDRYTLVERGQITKVLNESELALSGISSAKAIEVGKMVGAEGVIIGTVDEYGTVALKGHPYPVVGISLRLIDCGTSRIVWSVDQASRAGSKTSTLSTHARKIVHEMMSGLYQEWQRQKLSDIQKAEL